MDRFGPTAKVSNKLVHVLRWTTFFLVGPVGILVEWITPHVKCAYVTSVINVGRAVQTDPTFFRYASAITEQKKKLGVGGSISDCTQQLPTTPNNMQQGVKTDATCNIQQCWELSDISNVGRPMN